MHAYENEWFKSDESFSHTSERDSLDENALNNEEVMNEANTNQRAEDKPYYIEPRVATISRYDNATCIMYDAKKYYLYSYISCCYSVESMDIQNDFSRNSPIYTGHNIVNPLGKKIETTEL